MSVAVVILNWNGLRFLEKFVPILLKNTSSLSATIYVADNGSIDDSVEWLESTYIEGEVKVLEFEENLGFTGGYNKAFELIKEEGGEFKYYLLLNSDVEVTRGWLKHLVKFMNSHPKVGICSPKVLSYDNREYFEHAGACGGLLDKFYFPYCRGRILSKVEKDEGQYDEPTEVLWASGTSFMIRSELWHTLGGLDSMFFAHMEEIDMCWRARLLGCQVWVAPQSVIYHVGGGTLPNNSPRKLFLNFRNNLLMMYKNLPESSKDRIIFRRKCIDGIIAAIYLLTFKWTYFMAVLRAHQAYERLKYLCVISTAKCDVPRPEGMFLKEYLKHK